MDIFLFLKLVSFISIVILAYVIFKNIDVIKIILKYWKDLLRK